MKPFKTYEEACQWRDEVGATWCCVLWEHDGRVSVRHLGSEYLARLK